MVRICAHARLIPFRVAAPLCFGASSSAVFFHSVLVVCAVIAAVRHHHCACVAITPCALLTRTRRTLPQPPRHVRRKAEKHPYPQFHQEQHQSPLSDQQSQPGLHRLELSSSPLQHRPIRSGNRSGVTPTPYHSFATGETNRPLYPSFPPRPANVRHGPRLAAMIWWTFLALVFIIQPTCIMASTSSSFDIRATSAKGVQWL